MAKCPACTADNPDGAKTCEYCGTAIPSSQPAPQPDTPPVADKVSEAPPVETSAKPETDGIKTFKCDSCGAVVSYSAREKSLRCAYCGSTFVVDVPTPPNRTKPSRIVPFGVAKNKAMELFRKWLGKGFWRPGDLKKMASLGQMDGIYLPFWAFDVKTDSDWTASAGYNYTETETYRDKDGKTQTRNVTKTRWEPARGHRNDHYRDWLISASGGLEQGWVRRIIPFDLTTAKPYSPDYFAGWAAEEYSLEADDAMPIAEKEINDTEKDKCADLVPGDTHKDLRVSTRFSDWANELMVLPIWLSSYRYRDKVYRFLVNGQTGEVVGNAPTSKLKIAIAILVGLGLVGGAIALATIFGK